LKERKYLPPLIGEPNKFQVADKPVWIEVGIVSICFLLFGTHEGLPTARATWAIRISFLSR
jgi:hypothetical protein